MPTNIFVNLPVESLPASKTFFERLGFTFNPHFTDDTAACMVIDENVFAMLITKPRFRDFTPKAICDATRATEVLIALSRESREAVDSIVRDAVAAGGTTYKQPKDHGFMYEHGFEDLDGHIWEVMHMEPGAIPPQS